MNKKNAHLYLPYVQALADGKTIQVETSPTKKRLMEQEDYAFSLPPERYHIKPKPLEFKLWINDSDNTPSYRDDGGMERSDLEVGEKCESKTVCLFREVIES